jgi:apolipoprotein N-acyltransferase
LFKSSDKKSNTAREIINENIFYDAYNSAFFLNKNGDIEVYHKTKLVPGVEKMPFPKMLDPLAKLAVDLGGTSGSLASDNYLNLFKFSRVKISPLICYESVYGEMIPSEKNLITIITNDGWWKNTAGYKQHLVYATLRAIEQRKFVVRSANTGISAVVNSRGDIVQQSEWNEAVCLSSKVQLNNSITFYNRFGDYIGRLSAFVAIILLALSYVKSKLNT